MNNGRTPDVLPEWVISDMEKFHRFEYCGGERLDDKSFNRLWEYLLLWCDERGLEQSGGGWLFTKTTASRRSDSSMFRVLEEDNVASKENKAVLEPLPSSSKFITSTASIINKPHCEIKEILNQGAPKKEETKDGKIDDSDGQDSKDNKEAKNDSTGNKAFSTANKPAPSNVTTFQQSDSVLLLTDDDWEIV
jgi:hypothetical protein